MRFSEFIREDENGNGNIEEYSNVVTALSLLQNRIQSGDLKADVPTDMVIRYIQNTGLRSFNYQDLVAVNDAEPSMQNIVKNITPDTVTLATASDSDVDVDNPDQVTTTDAMNPQQTVSNMAKMAAARRQKPLF